MELESIHIFWIGMLVNLGFSMIVYAKLHRNTHVLASLFLGGFVCALIGLVLIRNPEYEMVRGHAAMTFFSPITYISLFQLFRLVFIKFKGIEPCYEYQSSYDSVDKRAMGLFDYIVYIIPLLLSMMVPLFVFHN